MSQKLTKGHGNICFLDIQPYFRANTISHGVYIEKGYFRHKF
ncbi:MAG: hypothetical protein HW390_1931 [Candidatus Brocadiaceae bacterium]|nr:hypothetical protein [Candidatus Brocadiaceae bacterium]